ncbi:MAG: cell division protein ZipA [Candidatus Endonucleobacter bathymodioli]|uniref:Cell division protein ZipA n=1 Tax=Candidatus Endonucleibacter bathymodioli TaxID=539814 RepID=A0AA90NSW3_9GAMM|nr:cell division protein ZipA [Candidatus Endonucleobacter bathymodioli]
MSLREWLVLTGIIVIVVVFIDGYRRMYMAKKRAGELEFGIFGLDEAKGDDCFGSELPNGGARILHADGGDVENKLVFDKKKNDRKEPDLLDVDLSNLKDAHDSGSFAESSDKEGAVGEIRVGGRIPADSSKACNYKGFAEAKIVPSLTDQDTFAEQCGERQINVVSREFLSPDLVRTSDDIIDKETSKFDKRLSKYKSKKMARNESKCEATEKLSDRPPAKEVIVINVVAKGGQIFDVEKLLSSTVSLGMRFGDMSIFHRYANDNGTGSILFSMANGLEPGVFSVDDTSSILTSVVSFFMRLPGPSAQIKSFTEMLEVARMLALDLGGELKDEEFSVMTQQTIEHYRQRIMDFERKQLAQKMPS